MSSTGLCRNTTDQFYTSIEVARLCVTLLYSIVPRDIPWIEPSAGTGVFLELVSDAIGYDIDPKHARIQNADFLSVTVPNGSLVFGNPPFGRQSSLAKKFIRHACGTADWIGFILPRSFQKPSMQKAFPIHFHLIRTMDVPKNAFIVDGRPHDVPCVFQIWKRESTPREAEKIETPTGFTFVKKTDTYTLAFRRVGAYAGRCYLPGDHSEQSHYFIRVDNPEKIVTASHTYTFPTNTTGPRSLSRGEATLFLNEAIANAATR